MAPPEATVSGTGTGALLLRAWHFAGREARTTRDRHRSLAAASGCGNAIGGGIPPISSRFTDNSAARVYVGMPAR